MRGKINNFMPEFCKKMNVSLPLKQNLGFNLKPSGNFTVVLIYDQFLTIVK